MNFKFQEDTISQLQVLASYGQHSILISGPPGVGKSYVAKLYRQYVGAQDFIIVQPNVQSIKSQLSECYNIEYPVVICIENLDLGVAGAAYALLKFLEEPKSNVYVIVTCRNIKSVPDTILSRSASLELPPPIASDIEMYAQKKDSVKYQLLRTTAVWRCVRSFSDVELVYEMTRDDRLYFDTLLPLLRSNECISNMVWALGHYPDNRETPVEYVIRYIMCNTDDSRIRKHCISCLNDLSKNNLGVHAVISKLVLELKYGD